MKLCGLRKERRAIRQGRSLFTDCTPNLFVARTKSALLLRFLDAAAKTPNVRWTQQKGYRNTEERS